MKFTISTPGGLLKYASDGLTQPFQTSTLDKHDSVQIFNNQIERNGNDWISELLMITEGL